MRIAADRHGRHSLLCSAVVLITISAYGSADIVRVGPEILPILTTIDQSAGSTFLVNDVVLGNGVLFAFSAFFVNTSRVHFQVWRPYKTSNQNSGATFQLVFQAPMTPSVSLSREDLYIASTLTNLCPVVQSGDTVGVFFESSPTAISRYFDVNGAATYRYQLQNLSVQAQVKDIVVFDTLRFPYKLNFQAWIDTSNDSIPLGVDGTSTENDFVDCPMALIPPHDTGTITISPGMTGATGPSGPRGNAGPIGATGPVGLLGATGPAGPFGPTGVRGNDGPAGDTGPFGASGVSGPDGQLGATGPIGWTGSNGEIGPVGPPGPPGPSVPVDIKALSSSDGCTGFFMSENFMIGMVIWLVILSLLLLTILVILITLCVELRSRGTDDKGEMRTVQPWITTSNAPVPTYPRPTVQNDYHLQGGTLARDPFQSRLREEMERNFPMDTIETAFDGSEVKAMKGDDPPYAVLRDPSTTSMSDGGVYNPTYMESASDAGDILPNDTANDAETSS